MIDIENLMLSKQLAMELIKINKPTDFAPKYKAYVIQLYQLMQEIDITVAKLEEPQEKLLSQVQLCPKCKEEISIFWKRHDKCGWKK